jgi:hypothetical protein
MNKNILFKILFLIWIPLLIFFIYGIYGEYILPEKTKELKTYNVVKVETKINSEHSCYGLNINVDYDNKNYCGKDNPIKITVKNNTNKILKIFMFEMYFYKPKESSPIDQSGYIWRTILSPNEEYTDCFVYLTDNHLPKIFYLKADIKNSCQFYKDDEFIPQ